MDVNALSNSLGPYLQSLLGTSNSASGAPTGVTSASLALPQDTNPHLSPFAQLLSSLQQLQQTDPAKYQQVTSQIATNLQNAAKTAATNGNSIQATELNPLAADFTNASQNNTLPNIQDLAKAAGGGHGHHHHHHAQTSSADPNQSGSATNLSQQISAFLVNATSPTGGSALNPMTIIENTLNNAGVSLS